MEIDGRIKRIERRLLRLAVAVFAFVIATIAVLIRFGLHLLVR